MSAQAFIHSTIQLARFREQVAIACRNSGHLQRELAGVLGIDPKVLSRKLHGAKQAYPSHLEVKRIILVLADWDAITTQLEAIQLLTLMGSRAGSFTPEEWASDPLNRLQSRPDLSSAPPAGLHPRPLQAPSTPLIGREKQIEHILATLENPSIRLLTLLGTGGIGKTRLALEIAHASQSKFVDGVGWLSLAATYDVTLVPAAIVQALGLQEPITIGDPGQRSIFSPEDQLITALQGREFLLVLDNVEHLPEIRYFINDLLTKVATLKILVTSRVVLHLSGEHIFKVPPLATGAPDDTLLDPETVEQIAAIRLFVDRAQALDPTFRLSAQTVEAVAQICARLDGLPLAIELAAGRTKVLPLHLILERLSDEAAQPLTFLRTTHYDV
ncbi:MAG TPA: NB-ARC domain-containing protein, partial [Ktedonobacteraceae bacterium]|nr:NB-ARC domain-containing protein [Ktedonobacteraceae bacterium]